MKFCSLFCIFLTSQSEVDFGIVLVSTSAGLLFPCRKEHLNFLKLLPHSVQLSYRLVFITVFRQNGRALSAHTQPRCVNINVASALLSSPLQPYLISITLAPTSKMINVVSFILWRSFLLTA
jgi:hypothetical protein